MTAVGPLSDWAQRESASGGWIRRMFVEGQRLRAEFGAEAVADLSIGQPLEATEVVRQAFAEGARDSFPGRFGYMSNSGYPELRERCAAEVAIPGVTAQSVTMSCGAAGAIALALRAFVESGTTVLGVAPYFPEFRLYAATLGCNFNAVAARPDLTIDIEALEEALTAETGAVLLNSPCNPSGHLVTDSEMRDVAELLRGHNSRHNRRVVLIVDEVYQRLLYPPATRIEAFDYYEATVLARSFSKDLGIAGERIGYLVVHPSMTSSDTERGIEMCARALGFVNAPATAQRALLSMASWDVDIDPYQMRRDSALLACSNAGIEAIPPDGGLYLWARSPWPDTLSFVDALAQRRVLVTPGVAFGVDSHFRICFSQPLAALELAGNALAATVA